MQVGRTCILGKRGNSKGGVFSWKTKGEIIPLKEQLPHLEGGVPFLQEIPIKGKSHQGCHLGFGDTPPKFCFLVDPQKDPKICFLVGLNFQVNKGLFLTKINKSVIILTHFFYDFNGRFTLNFQNVAAGAAENSTQKSI